MNLPYATTAWGITQNTCSTVIGKTVPLFSGMSVQLERSDRNWAIPELARSYSSPPLYTTSQHTWHLFTSTAVVFSLGVVRSWSESASRSRENMSALDDCLRARLRWSTWLESSRKNGVCRSTGPRNGIPYGNQCIWAIFGSLTYMERSLSKYTGSKGETARNRIENTLQAGSGRGDWKDKLFSGRQRHWRIKSQGSGSFGRLDEGVPADNC